MWRGCDVLLVHVGGERRRGQVRGLQQCLKLGVVFGVQTPQPVVRGKRAWGVVLLCVGCSKLKTYQRGFGGFRFSSTITVVDVDELAASSLPIGTEL